jgi:AcrR family transcriptional regulator
VGCQEEQVRSAPGLRGLNKAKRRAAILDGALRLMRNAKLENVSIEAIAAEADVAPATVYNLIGSRDKLLIACVDRVLESLVTDLVQIRINENPIEAALAIVQGSCEVFIADGDAFRQIVGAVNGLARSGESIAMDPAQLQISAMRAAKDAGLFCDDADPVSMGRQIFLSYNGAMFAWSAHKLTDEGFRAAAIHGLWTVLLAFSSDNHREEFAQQARSAARELAATEQLSPNI